MKKLLYILLFIPFVGLAQSNSLSSPMGNIISICPGTTITQSSGATVFFTETIPAGTLIPNKWYAMEMHFKLTTPVVGIPGITATFQLGSSTYTCMSSAALVGGQTNGYFRIRFRMVAATTTSQIPIAELIQSNGTLIALGSSVTPVGSFSADSSVSNTFSVTIQFTGTSLGTSSLSNFWTFRDAF